MVTLRHPDPQPRPLRLVLIFGGMRHGRPLASSRSASRRIVEIQEDDSMN